MTPAEALQRARDPASAGGFFITLHARTRMARRGVRAADVRHGLMSASQCRLQDNGCGRFDTKDTADDELSLVVAFESGMIIVTVYQGMR